MRWPFDSYIHLMLPTGSILEVCSNAYDNSSVSQQDVYIKKISLTEAHILQRLYIWALMMMPRSHLRNGFLSMPTVHVSGNPTITQTKRCTSKQERKKEREKEREREKKKGVNSTVLTNEVLGVVFKHLIPSLPSCHRLPFYSYTILLFSLFLAYETLWWTGDGREGDTAPPTLSIDRTVFSHAFPLSLSLSLSLSLPPLLSAAPPSKLKQNKTNAVFKIRLFPLILQNLEGK